MFNRKFNFSPGELGTIEVILLNGILQDTEAFSGMMKIGYGFTQPRIRQIYKQVLELAEGFTGLKRLNW